MLVYNRECGVIIRKDLVMAYKVKAQPDGRYWCVEVPAIGRATMATSVRDIDVMAKDLIEFMTGEVDPDIEVEYP